MDVAYGVLDASVGRKAAYSGSPQGAQGSTAEAAIHCEREIGFNVEEESRLFTAFRHDAKLTTYFCDTVPSNKSNLFLCTIVYGYQYAVSAGKYKSSMD